MASPCRQARAGRVRVRSSGAPGSRSGPSRCGSRSRACGRGTSEAPPVAAPRSSTRSAASRSATAVTGASSVRHIACWRSTRRVHGVFHPARAPRVPAARCPQRRPRGPGRPVARDTGGPRGLEGGPGAPRIPHQAQGERAIPRSTAPPSRTSAAASIDLYLELQIGREEYVGRMRALEASLRVDRSSPATSRLTS